MSADPFLGPKLKVERAKSHINELRVAIDAFHESGPYTYVENVDPKTGENVIRVHIAKCIPGHISTIIGDVVHNLRSALDQLVCALVEANRRQVRRGTGFPISGTVQHFEANAIGKIKGVNARAERLIRRLKPYKGGNTPLWILHELDALDKHSGIIPVAGAHVVTVVHMPLPIFGIGEGELTIGAVLPGQKAALTLPVHRPRIGPLKDGMEMLRAPADFSADVDISTHITFDQTQITQSEPVVETLLQLAEFVERALGIFERRTL